jgi:hypothetical protein
MIDLRPAIRTILLADPQINAMVGGSRVYASILPQGQTLTSIVQNMISEDMSYHMKGDSGLMMVRTQLDCWSKSSDEAVKLGGYVFDALTGFSAQQMEYGSASPKEKIDIDAVFHDQGRDDYDTTAIMHTRRRDFIFWYRVRS